MAYSFGLVQFFSLFFCRCVSCVSVCLVTLFVQFRADKIVVNITTQAANQTQNN